MGENYVSVHKECGEDIRWAHRDDQPDRFRPPLEYAGQVFIIDERDVAIMVHSYRPHRCDPDKMVAWQEYQEKIAAIKERKVPDLDMSPWQIKKERDLDATWEAALKVPCPRCEVPAGEKCRSLLKQHVKTGEIVHVKNPHTARIEQ